MALLLALLATPALAALQRGQAAFERHQPRLARVELMNAVAERPRDPRPRLALARVLLALGDGPAAEAELRRAREVGASAAAVRAMLAEAAWIGGDPRRALAEATGGPADDLVAARRMEGRARAALGDTGGAAAAFDAAMRARPKDAALWADLARFRLSTGERAGANAAAARAAQLAPGDPDVLTLRGALVRDQYGHRAALPWFDRALAITPDHRGARLARAASYAELGRNRELLADTRAVIAFSPNDPEALLAQALLAARAGDWDLASGILARVGRRLERDPALLLLRGAVNLQRGNAAQAVLDLQPLSERQPDNAKVRRLLARALLARGDARAAAATLGALSAQGDADAYGLELHARAAERLGDREIARRSRTRAAAPAAPGAVRACASHGTASPAGEAINDMRCALAAGPGGATGAIARGRALAAANPGAPDAHLALGDALALGGAYAGAAEHYRRAANIQFGEPAALRLVDALARAGRAGEAAAVLSLFAGQNPQNSRARLLLANSALLAGDGPRAAVDYAQVRALWGTQDAAALLGAAWAEWAAGDARRALLFARLAHARAPANRAVADGLGWMLWRTGRDRPRALLMLAAARTGRF